MARVDFFCNPWPWPETFCPVAVTDPEIHPKNKAQSAQSPFVYERSTTFNKKMNPERDFKNW